jgi:pilus assembly protein Flp/PilA
LGRNCPQSFILKKRNPSYAEVLRQGPRKAVERLRTYKDGVVSFEYVIVVACIVAAVAAAFGSGGAGPINTALKSAITAIGGLVTTAT